MPPTIQCVGVSKAFVMCENRQYLRKDRAVAMLRPHFRENRETSWALRDVGFAVEPGAASGRSVPTGFLIDEVLAVGDEHFQGNSLRRREEDRHSGRTFLSATHARSVRTLASSVDA